jgi:hypothetical protein
VQINKIKRQVQLMVNIQHNIDYIKTFRLFLIIIKYLDCEWLSLKHLESGKNYKGGYMGNSAKMFKPRY